MFTFTAIVWELSSTVIGYQWWTLAVTVKFAICEGNCNKTKWTAEKKKQKTKLEYATFKTSWSILPSSCAMSTCVIMSSVINHVFLWTFFLAFCVILHFILKKVSGFFHRCLSPPLGVLVMQSPPLGENLTLFYELHSTSEHPNVVCIWELSLSV